VSLIEDARRISEAEAPLMGDAWCWFCHARLVGFESVVPDQPHNQDCPWLSLPRIVRALEAARDVLDHIDDIEWAQDSLRHDEDTARLREAMNDAP